MKKHSTTNPETKNESPLKVDASGQPSRPSNKETPRLTAELLHTLSTERLERQGPLALTVPASVSIVGCGGVGSWTALFLALAGVPRLLLWDNDTVERHNLNRLPLPPTAIGENKARALAAMIGRMVPTCEVIALPLWTADAATALGYGSIGGAIHWIVAATDTHASRVEVYEHARSLSFRYIECSAEGEFGGCTGSPATFITPEETQPGYAHVPVWVGSSVMAAAMTGYHILHGVTDGNMNWRIGWENGRLVFQDLGDLDIEQKTEGNLVSQAS